MRVNNCPPPWPNGRQFSNLWDIMSRPIYNVIITPLPSGQLEIIPPSGHIIPPLGCIILPSGCLDLRSTASLRQDNAPLWWNNVAFWQYNFHCPSGQVVIISHCWQSCKKHFALNELKRFKVRKQSWSYDNTKQPLLSTFSQKIEFSIIQVLIQASNLKITAEWPNGAAHPWFKPWFIDNLQKFYYQHIHIHFHLL